MIRTPEIQFFKWGNQYHSFELMKVDCRLKIRARILNVVLFLPSKYLFGLLAWHFATLRVDFRVKSQ